jgi:hypothetical protein
MRWFQALVPWYGYLGDGLFVQVVENHFDDHSVIDASGLCMALFGGLRLIALPHARAFPEQEIEGAQVALVATRGNTDEKVVRGSGRLSGRSQIFSIISCDASEPLR